MPPYVLLYLMCLHTPSNPKYRTYLIILTKLRIIMVLVVSCANTLQSSPISSPIYIYITYLIIVGAPKDILEEIEKKLEFVSTKTKTNSPNVSYI